MSTFITTPTNTLRDTITNAYRINETECLQQLIPEATLPPSQVASAITTATQFVTGLRTHKDKLGNINLLLQQYDLSTEEGIALMCLAEALLRIPDKTTMDKFISDKLSTAAWQNHLHLDNAFFVNAATWSLLLTGKMYAPTLDRQQSLISSLKRAGSRLSATIIRPIILQMMKLIGNQFVIGETIESALKNSTSLEKRGYSFSYDMLGESARTAADAKQYYAAYVHAIDVVGQHCTAIHHSTDNTAPSISVKLSALYPRYEYTQHEHIMQAIPPLLLTLAQQAKKYQMRLIIDAEEADRLEVSLDIFEMIYTHPSLIDWEGFGLAIQAYQKRTSFVVDWLAALATRHHKRIMVRLVKGAYWDAEIKTTQVQGLNNYPVFTRKNATDVAYLACAKKLLAHPDCFYPQFGTHNAYSVAAILAMAGTRTDYEFQCLYGMGQPLYDQIIAQHHCRIYAPVGTHKHLLGYLVRRLLENGANTSFINHLTDDNIPIEKIVYDPVARIAALGGTPHPRIPLPKNIYGAWENSEGFDLSDRRQFNFLLQQMAIAEKEKWVASPLINGKTLTQQPATAVTSPSAISHVIGHVYRAGAEQVALAFTAATNAAHTWANTPVATRAAILERAAIYFQEDMPALIAIMSREGGKCLLDAMSEVRETIDYCRYYAYRARNDLTTMTLPGPTGETNQLSLHPRGVIACISPWNFPLAIFTGQIIAALVTGNTVIAKPAEQTPLIAYRAIQILHRAGIPTDVLHLLIGRGSVVGPALTNDARLAGVMFTGSTETAKSIEQSLANRPATVPIAMFVAETGGQNAMIVDSSALPEQTIIDIVQSAFNSAGQRCSALRVLFLQEDIADQWLEMLRGYLAEIYLGDPYLLATDVGPVIDAKSQQMLQTRFAKMQTEAKLIAQVPLGDATGGHYFAPCVFELQDLNQLEGEIFGPILHVIRYRATELEKVMEAIIRTGYGLTLGIHSRIDATVQHVIDHMPVGNMYVNRNMIGAVVGVQPFGGERLSGTGPKAGGPHYLPRLCVERAVSINTTAIGGNARLVSLLEDDE